jgi:hypothetical protein
VDLRGRKSLKDEVIYNAEHCTTYSPKKGTKCGGIKGTGQAAVIRELQNALRIYIRRSEGKCHFDRLNMNEMVTLKCIKKISGKGDPLLTWFINGTMGGLN